MNQHVDLEVLQRSAPAQEPKRRGNRLLWGVLLVAALGVAYVVLRPILDPPRAVRVVRARAASPGAGGGAVVRSGSSVVAAGWLEADPFPTSVRPLVKGVVRELAVLEGQSVTKDETIIAQLDNLEVLNALDLAKAEHALRVALRDEAAKALEVAQTLLDQKLDLRQRVADLEGKLEAAAQAIARARARRTEVSRQVETARVDLKAQERVAAAGGSTPVALERAKTKFAEVQSRGLQLQAEEQRLREEQKRQRSLLALAKEGRDDPRALQGEVTNRTAAHVRAAAAVQAAQTRVDVAQRNVNHLTVHAPMTGTVLRLNCAPGGLVGPQGEFMGMGEANATGGLNRLTGAIVTLYDPAKIQARVDVPLAEVAGIEVGTRATIEVDAAKGRSFEGTVTRLVHEADLSKNTLQVKVKIDAPEGLLRPEMLCRARFDVGSARPASADAPAPSGNNGTWLVPSEAVRNGAVFVFDPTRGGRARRVAVTPLGQDGADTRVQGALGRSSQIVLDAVSDGERVQPQEQP